MTCVSAAAFTTVAILSYNTTKAGDNLARYRFCPEDNDKISFFPGVLPQDAGCPQPTQPTKEHGIYAAHLTVLSSIVRSSKMQPERPRWHLILEQDAVAGNFVLRHPTWFADTAEKISRDTVILNLGPNDILFDWTHFVDRIRWMLGQRLMVLPRYGVMTHAYAVTDVGAAIILQQLYAKRCAGKGIDEDVSELSDRMPNLAMRAFYKHERPQPHTKVTWGLFAQRKL